MTKKKKQPAKKTRKSASDSLTSAKSVMAAASLVIKPPASMELKDEALSYFNDIINERANADWAAHDIAIAAKLARYMVREDVLSDALDEEGVRCIGAQGGYIKNPTATVLSDTSSKIIALRRSLCLHAQGKNQGIKSVDIGRRNSQRRAIQDAGSHGDPLLAG